MPNPVYVTVENRVKNSKEREIVYHAISTHLKRYSYVSLQDRLHAVSMIRHGLIEAINDENKKI